jgi:hypothetical protein
MQKSKLKDSNLWNAFHNQQQIAQAKCNSLLCTPTNQTVALHSAAGWTKIYTAHSWTAVINFGATKPPARREDGDRISSLNVFKPSHLDMAVRENVIESVLVNTDKTNVVRRLFHTS